MKKVVCKRANPPRPAQYSTVLPLSATTPTQAALEGKRPAGAGAGVGWWGLEGLGMGWVLPVIWVLARAGMVLEQPA